MKKSLIKTGLFSPNLEVFHLILPVIFLGIIFRDIYSKQFTLGSLSSIQTSILVNIIFLNITHNAFTPIFLTSSEVLKKWISYHGGESVFWRKQLTLVVLLTIFFSVILYLSSSYKSLLVIFNLINFNFAAHHALSQSFGLSLIYNRHSPDMKQKKIADKSERILFSTFLILTLIAGTFVYMPKEILTFLPFNKMAQYLKFILLLVGSGLVAQAVYFYKKDLWAKWIFSLRYLIWPLSFFSSFAILATEIIHGIEYGLVTDKILKKDSFLKPKLALYLLTLIVVFAGLRIYGFEKIYIYETISPWLVVGTAFSVAISFAHYFLDRKLFKMRYEINRNTVGTLLFSTPQNEGANEK
jgi:hypothetical protein